MLVEAITAMGMDISSYGWYLDLRKYGTVPHAGKYQKSDTAQSVLVFNSRDTVNPQGLDLDLNASSSSQLVCTIFGM